jgi:hypothetical protein
MYNNKNTGSLKKKQQQQQTIPQSALGIKVKK